MPNLCGNYLVESNGKMSRDDELKLVWASSSVMGGGMDTVSAIRVQFAPGYLMLVSLEHVHYFVFLNGHDFVP